MHYLVFSCFESHASTPHVDPLCFTQNPKTALAVAREFMSDKKDAEHVHAIGIFGLEGDVRFPRRRSNDDKEAQLIVFMARVEFESVSAGHWKQIWQITSEDGFMKVAQ